jgi:hypothetical protein
VKKIQQNEDTGERTEGISPEGKDKREFFRVNAYIHLLSGLVLPEERANIGSRTLSETPDSSWTADTLKGVDISGSGIAFDSDDFYALGDIVELKIMLKKDGGVPLLVYGEVVRVEPHLYYCRVALKYVDMDERIRGIITQFIFEREREMIAKKKVGWL